MGRSETIHTYKVKPPATVKRWCMKCDQPFEADRTHPTKKCPTCLAAQHAAPQERTTRLEGDVIITKSGITWKAGDEVRMWGKWPATLMRIVSAQYVILKFPDGHERQVSLRHLRKA